MNATALNRTTCAQHRIMCTTRFAFILPICARHVQSFLQVCFSKGKETVVRHTLRETHLSRFNGNTFGTLTCLDTTKREYSLPDATTDSAKRASYAPRTNPYARYLTSTTSKFGLQPTTYPLSISSGDKCGRGLSVQPLPTVARFAPRTLRTSRPCFPKVAFIDSSSGSSSLWNGRFARHRFLYNASYKAVTLYQWMKPNARRWPARRLKAVV